LKEEIVLSLKDYMPLYDLVTSKGLILIKLLGQVANEREYLAGILIKLFHAKQQLVEFLGEITSDEIQNTRNQFFTFDI
jgi:hypothetical protein